MQILERQADANIMWPADSSARKEAERVCQNWESWYNDQSNWAEPPADCSFADKEFCFQEDSGI